MLIRLIVIIDIALRDEFLYTIHQKNLNNLKKISAVEQIKRFPKLPFDSNENLEITEERRLKSNSNILGTSIEYEFFNDFDKFQILRGKYFTLLR